VPPDFNVYAQRRVQARALDNQLYMIYCNFSTPGFPGQSLVTDPFGGVVAQAGASEELLSVTLNLNRMYTWREKERIFNQRRPRLYRVVAETLPDEVI
jgi:predicted amidohydrolase